MEKKPSNEDFVLIGAGLPRTGTLSTRIALSIVLDGPCYHMTDVFESQNADAEFWQQALEGKISPEKLRMFFNGNGYRAGVDYPCSLFYK